MAIKIKGGDGPVFRGPQLSDVGGSVSYGVTTVRLSGGSFNLYHKEDAIYQAYTGAEYYRGGTIRVEGFLNHRIKNLTPSIAAVSEDGTVNRLSSGILRVRILANGLQIPIIIDLTQKTDEDDQPETYLARIKGGLSEHCTSQVDARLATIAGTPTVVDNGRVFVTQDHANQSYIRNPNLWLSQLNPVDLTCISPWNSNGGHRKAGVLITPRHILNAAHYEYNVGTTVRFVNMAGDVFNYTIVGKRRHPNYRPYSPDLTLYTLDADVDASTSPCELMPSDYIEYLPEKANWHNRPPGLGLDQEEKALPIDFYRLGGFRVPVDPARLALYENIITGDSGNPGFMVIQDKLVLVTVWSGPLGGTPVANYINDLNQMIVDADTQAGVSTGHTVSEADFSAWPNLTTKDYVLEDHDIANGNASAWKDVNGDGTVYRYYKASLSDYEEARIDGGVWKIFDEADSLIATGNSGGDITAATFDNGYIFSTP